jgi:hypothetical protein
MEVSCVLAVTVQGKVLPLPTFMDCIVVAHIGRILCCLIELPSFVWGHSLFGWHVE